MSESKKTVIKKYPNRRLYNTETSVYIKLDDLVELIKHDEEFIVIDVKTGEDITRITLAQMLLDHETKGMSLLPEPLIKAAIKFHNHPINMLMHAYLIKMLEQMDAMKDITFIDSAMEFSKNLEAIGKENLDFFSNIFFPKSTDNKKNTESKKNKGKK